MWITSRYGSDHCQIGLKHWTMINDLSWFLLSHLISVYSLIVCWCLVRWTPLKINGWYIIMEVWFRSCSFLFMGDGCRFQPLIFEDDPSVNIQGWIDRQWNSHQFIQYIWSLCQLWMWEGGKFNSSPLKNGAGKTTFLRYLFRCYAIVSWSVINVGWWVDVAVIVAGVGC